MLYSTPQQIPLALPSKSIQNLTTFCHFHHHHKLCLGFLQKFSQLAFALGLLWSISGAGKLYPKRIHLDRSLFL